MIIILLNATVTNGIIREKTTSQYSLITDELAKRTYAESGDYYVKSFGINLKESLNNYEGNRGVFNADQTTYGGSVPSDDLAVYQISPGKLLSRVMMLQQQHQHT